ncbi:MAG: hypothetical protein CFE39_14360 [Comamonadaceae bacterium PBBC2]|nr:MAG: hypothetical protein CFE39_14360 [Comamonadaceae bacterium PBBC2]
MTTNTVVPDTTPPTVLVQSSATTLSTGQTATITFTLTEASSNFVVGDVVVNGGTLGSFQQSGANPLVYTAVFTPTANSTTPASVYVPSLSFTDAAGNNNVDGADTGVSNTNIVNMTVNTVPADTTPPTVAISSSTNTLSYGQTATLTLVFSEAVTDIAAGDFTLSGGAISNLVAVAGTNNTVYTATYTPAANSTANSVISIASNKFSDAAANFNIDGADANNTVTITTNTLPALALVNDTATVGEAGGTGNATAGTALASTVSGVVALNVLSNDTSATSVTGVASGATNGTMGQSLVGQYGTLTLNADGTYTYAVSDSNTTVQALKGSGNTLSDVFTYTASDGATSKSANLTITITGANDAPVAVADTATAVEAGGSANGSAGTNATGNVLTNDTDVDSGDTKAVSAITGGTLGSAKAGTYGSLTLNADGSYSYVVDNSNASVQALRTSANTLSDTFTYTVQDAAGATSTATLTVTVQGANDAPTVANTLSNQTGTVGSAITSYVVPTNTFADVDTVTNETSTLSAKLANGSALSTIGLTFDPASKTFSGTPTAAGTYTIVVTDTDAGGLTAQTTFDIVIASPILPTTTITQINGDGAPTAAPTLTITDSTTAGAAITGYAAASVTGTPSVVRYKFDFNTSVSNFALADISFVDSATGAAIASGNVGTLQGSGSSYYVDVTMPTGSGSVAAIVKDGSYNAASNALLTGTGSSFVQAYSGTGGSFGTSTVTSAGNLTTPIALTLSNGNVVSYYSDLTTPNPGAFVLFNSSGQVIKSLTNLPNSGGTIKGGERQGNVFETQNGGFGFLSRITGTNTEQLVTYDSTGTLVSGPTTLTGIGLGDDFPATTTSDGHLAIAYPGSDFNTHVRKVSLTPGANFGTQMTDTIVAGTGSSPATSAPAELVRLSNGDLGFVWNPLVNGGASNQSFSYRILNSDGSIKSATVGSINISSLPAMQISGDTALYLGTDSTSMGSMKAIATSDGGMAIVFEVNSNDASPQSELALVRIDASGARTTTTIFGETAFYNVGLQPDMTQLPSGQLMVLWNDKGANQFQSKYQIVNSDGTLSGSATTLSSLTYGGDLVRFNSTAIANLAGGKVLAIQNGNYVVLSPADGTQTITGTTGDNTQMGGAGADTLTGGGGADIILAGAGNDTVVINASNISSLTTAGKLLDGGAGIDTLRIGADTSTLDLSKSTVQANVQNFEKIDLGSDAVANTVILNATAVQRLATQNLDGSTTNKQLIIDGTSSDIVKLSGQYDNGILAGYWQPGSTPTRTIGGVTYKVYTISSLSGVEVLVNNAITSANTDTAYQMASGDIVTLPNTSVVIGDLEATATGGSTGTGDGGSQQPANRSSTTSDTSPLVQGTLSQALAGTQVLKLYRSNVTDGGSAVEVSANVTTSGTSWQYQDAGLTAGKQYTYEAKIFDGSTLVDASNTYTINQAASAPPDTTPPTIALTRSGSGTMTGAETITFTLSEVSTDFASSDVVYSGGTLSGFAGSGTTYTATFTPTASATGTAQVGVHAGTFKDAAGNLNQDDYSLTGGANNNAENINNQISTAFNTVPPSPTITSIISKGAPASGPYLVISDNQAGTASTPTVFSFDFSSAVTGFTQSDITFIRADTGAVLTPTAFTGSGSSYTATIATQASGTVSQILVKVADGVAFDAATGAPATGNTWSQAFGGNNTAFTVASSTPALGNNGTAEPLTNGNSVYLARYFATNTNVIVLYDGNGNAIAQTSLPQEAIDGSEIYSDVAAMANGEFAIFYKNGFATYSADGVLKGSAVAFTSTTAAANMSNVNAAQLADGKYIVMWADSLSKNIKSKIINADGTDSVAEAVIGSTMSTLTPANLGADIVKLSNGKYAMVYQGDGGSGIQLVNADGSLGGFSTFPASSGVSAGATVTDMKAVALSGGGFAVLNYVGSQLRLHIFNNNGGRTSETLILSNTNPSSAYSGFLNDMDITQLSDGKIALIYTGGYTNSSISYSNSLGTAAVYNLDGTLFATVAANSSSLDTTNYENSASIIALTNGGFGAIYRERAQSGGGDRDNFSMPLITQVWNPPGDYAKTTSSSTYGANLGGSESADTITATGAMQTVNAGAGNDTVTINAAFVNALAFSSTVDGGSGSDTLALSGTGITLDLANPAMAQKVTGFEIYDLGSNGSNTLNLSVSTVLRLTLATSQILVKGDTSDVVNLSKQFANGAIAGTWSTQASTTVNGVTYDVYTNTADSSKRVLIQTGVIVRTDYAIPSSQWQSLSTDGTAIVGDVENAQNPASADATSDPLPVIRGTIPQNLQAGQSIQIYRVDVTSGGSEVLLGTATTTGTNFTYQETQALSSSHQYSYIAKLVSGGSTSSSNAYTINAISAGTSYGQTTPASSAFADSAVAPTLTITDLVPSVSPNSSKNTFLFNFSEKVNGFDLSDITVTNGTKGSTLTKISDTQYSLEVTSPSTGNGTTAVSVATGTYTDVDNNLGLGATGTQAYGQTSAWTAPTSTTLLGSATISNGGAVKLANGSSAYLGGGSNANQIVLVNPDGTTSQQSLPTGTVNGSETNADITATSNGFAVFSPGNFVKYNADGSFISGPTAFTGTSTSVVQAAELGNGNFLITYISSNTYYTKIINGTTGADVSSSPTQLGATGDAATSNPTTGMNFDAAKLSDGRLVVAYSGNGSGGYQIYDASGAPTGNFQAFPAQTTRELNIAPLQNGGFVMAVMDDVALTWRNYNQGGPTPYEWWHFNIVDPDGSMGKNIYPPVSAGSTTPTDISVAVLANGNIAVTDSGYTYNADPLGNNYSSSYANTSIYSSSGTYLGYNSIATGGGNRAIGSPTVGQVVALTGGDYGVIYMDNINGTPYVQFGAFKQGNGAITASGSTGIDTFYGQDGNDAYSGGGGADKIYMGAGDDTLVLNASNVTQLGTSGAGSVVDGGAGIDVLKLDTSALANITLDLTNVTTNSNLTGFEVFDITGNGSNIMKLNVSDVLQSNMALSSATHVVQIMGGSNDTVNLSKLLDNGTFPGTWSTTSTTTISGTTYNVYNYSADPTLQVLIDNHIASVNVNIS